MKNNKNEFALQIDNDSISNCSYDNENIKCELFGNLEKAK